MEPTEKRVIAFVDGQNLFHSAKDSFGYTYPNYDVLALSNAICGSQTEWKLVGTRFYTGVPNAADNPHWATFWSKKLLAMSRQGVYTYSRSLRYRNRVIRLPDGTEHSYLSGEEKGIDVRIAIDVLGLAYKREYDVALIFSQDQDLSEVAAELRVVARDQGRWIKVSSTFPQSPTSRNRRGIDKTDWHPIDRRTYDACMDHKDHRSA